MGHVVDGLFSIGNQGCNDYYDSLRHNEAIAQFNAVKTRLYVSAAAGLMAANHKHTKTGKPVYKYSYETKSWYPVVGVS